MIPWECTLLYIICFHSMITNDPFITVRLNLPEPSKQNKSAWLQEDRSSIQSTLDKCLPPVIGPEELRTVHDVSKDDVLEFQTLISLWRLHQRRQAQTGTRHKHTNQTKMNSSKIPVAQPSSSSNQTQAQASSSSTPAPEPKLSRGDLLREFQAVIKAQEERGLATAMGRKVRCSMHYFKVQTFFSCFRLFQRFLKHRCSSQMLITNGTGN